MQYTIVRIDIQLGGGILNNGDLTLDHVTVTNNTMVTDVGQFWQGGAGIYVGEGGSLSLIDSTVSDNDSGYAGGGIYAFFNTEVTITRSTISGNLAQDVGGGLRSLGNVTILNSTLSGNVAIAFHGGRRKAVLWVSRSSGANWSKAYQALDWAMRS